MGNQLEQNLEYASLHLATLQTLEGVLANIDVNSPDCFKDAIDIFVIARVEQKALASRLGVGPTTVSRWSTKTILPRSPPFRKWVLLEMREMMRQVIHEQEEKVAKLQRSPKKRTPLGNERVRRVNRQNPEP